MNVSDKSGLTFVIYLALVFIDLLTLLLVLSSALGLQLGSALLLVLGYTDLMVHVPEEEKNMEIFENDQLLDSNLQPHPHRRSTTKLADFSATVDPALAKAPIFNPPADTKLVMEPRSEKNSDDTSLLLCKASALTDDVSEDHIDNSEPDDKLASVLVMLVMMKTHI